MMNIFNFFKKKETQTTQKVVEKIISKEKEKVHPFIERCEYLKNEYGLIIPDVYKDFFTKNQISKDQVHYRIFWEEINYDDFEFVFYTENFVKYIMKRFDEKFGSNADWKVLQNMLEEAELEYKRKKNSFEAENIDLSFIDQCYEERGRNKEDLIITLNVYADCGGGEYLIMTSDKKGYSGGCYHGMTADIEHNNNIISYHILENYTPISNRIREIDQYSNQ